MSAVGAGDLDRRVQFRRAAIADNGIGKTLTFADHGTPVWASKRDVSDGEKYRAAEVQAVVTTRFVVRWSSFTAGITPKDRLVCGGREYEISGVKEIGRREFVEITAAARQDK
jgi:SPP1 family predicted phage head-tail adaptor